jgi:hypothetical protein
VTIPTAGNGKSGQNNNNQTFLKTLAMLHGAALAALALLLVGSGAAYI